jgi:hypothetical protein
VMIHRNQMSAPVMSTRLQFWTEAQQKEEWL